MNTRLLNIINEESQDVTNSPALPTEGCTSPSLGELLPDYIAELLKDSIAREIEEHLLDCLPCRNKHLKVLGISDAIRKSKAADEQSLGGARVLRMPNLKRS